MNQATGLTVTMPPTHRPWRARMLMDGMTREWSWLFALAAIDLLWCWRIGMTFAQLHKALLSMALLILAHLACRRLPRTQRLGDACEAAAFWFGFMLAGCILSYLVATWGLALWDVSFARMDAALGFDWLRWRLAVVAHPPLHRLLSLAYLSLQLQVLLAVLFFALVGRRRCGDMLFRAAFVSLMITTVVSGSVPALGPVSLHGLSDLAPYLHDLLALRAGHEIAFTTERLHGIITFPSYHAVLAVLIAWSFRHDGIVGIMIGLWNMLMLISVMSEGGHYLVDAIAGVAVAAASLWLTRASLPAAGSVTNDPVSVPAGARRP